MNDKEIIVLLQRQLEVSQATIEGLRTALSEMKSTIEDLKKTIRSLEQALKDKGVETARTKKALKNVAALMEKHNERQPLPIEPDPEFTPKAEKTKYDPKSRGNNGARRLEHMECEERVIVVAPQGVDLAGARFLRYQTSIRYRVEPMKIIKEIHKVALYSKDGTIISGKAPVTPLQNSNFDGSFIAFCAQMHYMYSMPMNRIASWLADNDFRIGRGTIGGLLSKATAVFSRLHECLRQAVLEDSYISGDETFHKVRVEEKNDKGLKIKKGYIWNLVAHHLRLAYFFYSRGSRSEKVFEEIIEGYNGTFQSDAMSIYRKLGDGKYYGINRIACLQHIKRRFIDIKEIPKAAEILRLFNLLYDREHRHRIGRDGWTVADNLQWREEYAPPILARIEEKLNAVKTDPHVPADSDLMGAVKYALNEWEWVPAIFSRGDYDLDNNLIERMQRLVSLLRRNSLFFGSHKGGETAAMYLSLVVSCRLNGVNVMEYISDILNRCASWSPTTPLEQYRNLLPDRWKRSETAD